MTRTEQHKLIAELREYAKKMTRTEQEEFAMFVKRHKDDEDLDELSKGKILGWYETYIVQKPKKVVRSPFGDLMEK